MVVAAAAWEGEGRKGLLKGESNLAAAVVVQGGILYGSSKKGVEVVVGFGGNCFFFCCCHSTRYPSESESERKKMKQRLLRIGCVLCGKLS